MTVSKQANGLGAHGGEEHGSAAAVQGASLPGSASSHADAGRTARIAARPFRPSGGEGREQVGEAMRAMALDASERKYSFKTLLAAGFLGYVIGRLFSH